MQVFTVYIFRENNFSIVTIVFFLSALSKELSWGHCMLERGSRAVRNMGSGVRPTLALLPDLMTTSW